ncbi:hypothetical protein [Longimicrobium sp.]|uniref:hypothetical protein n=1 Tax=Longimicrobium sp. TaxID=2029185 RepID=UPI002E3488F0|nr:hypothetical protein [Longimicrobium sp.]HEX6041108.1 hypothetical protein [Longimicrobium sp.]
MRILCWNIESFTSRRITPQPGATPAETHANAASARANLAYITSTVAQADPDVFTIVEARSNQGPVATLAEGEGPAGLLALLGELRALDPGWCLVPPLRLNPRDLLGINTHTETAGVFWRDDRLQFTGPFLWPAKTRAGPPVPNGPVVTGLYPAPWHATVPAGTSRAAQCIFYRDGAEWTFPHDWNRRPFLTRFSERAGKGRSIRLFSVHTKPGTTASTAVTRLSGMDPADWVPGADEVTVFAGDLNLNLADTDSETTTALQLCQDKGLRLLRPWSFPALRPTRYLPRSVATPGRYSPDEILDFALVRWGTPPGMPVPRPVIVDAERVAGVTPGAGLPAFADDLDTPLATITAPRAMGPLGALRAGGTAWYLTETPHGLEAGDPVTVAGVTDPGFNGSFTVASIISGTQFSVAQPGLPDAWQGGGAVVSANGVNRIFRRMENFGHLGPPAQNVGTSDHLPIFFIV